MRISLQTRRFLTAFVESSGGSAIYLVCDYRQPDARQRPFYDHKYTSGSTYFYGSVMVTASLFSTGFDIVCYGRHAIRFDIPAKSYNRKPLVRHTMREMCYSVIRGHPAYSRETADLYATLFSAETHRLEIFELPGAGN
jgi:hypothetical protein